MAENCTHDCNTCGASCPSKNGTKKIEKLGVSRNTKIKKIIGVSSGKGGVGKSFVTSLLACGMKRRGYNVAILDADILGPSIPRAFGIFHADIEATEDNLMIPIKTKNDIGIMSSNLLLQEETSPIIYRGSLIAGILQQFYSETMWGDIDYLFIDMPPGTGDVALTTYQQIPIDSVIIVSSPQNLVEMIVAKSINMAKKMNIDVLGILENMSYVECPNCKTKIEVFGNSRIKMLCDDLGVHCLGQLPLKAENNMRVDRGQVYDVELPELNNCLDILEKLLK